ncbi:RNA-guided endonuclease InsQ/TnpB family protein [Candidatus Uabimicrobium sp. HlEnr_7]|uniref:RNA-guided endonuclease InsQ/TnpB family protein n=1 Tax=Candidatus Uabimicrobium helgolandensis TaxID=3095367 RepID=UPI00355692A7
MHSTGNYFCQVTYPNKKQRQLLRNWFGCARFVYNKTIHYLKQPNTTASWMKIKKQILDDLSEWSKETPFQIKSIAIKDACKAVQNAKKKFAKTGKVQEVKFKSRKKRDECIYIPKSAVKQDSFYKRKMGKLLLREVVGKAYFDCRVVFQQGRFFLVKPEGKPVMKPENQRSDIVALDPGVRSFQTFYTKHSCGKVGCGDFGRIVRLCHHLDQLTSRISKAKSRRKKRMKKAADRMRWKIKDLISEIHHKTANFLCKHFEIIIIPPFETSQMVLRSKRKIRSKTVRAMLNWSHFKFKNTLKSKAELLSSIVIEQNEAYTSKTCSSCGYVKENIGGHKFFNCSSCKKRIDRDFNGARGIFLRALGDNLWLHSL